MYDPAQKGESNNIDNNVCEIDELKLEDTADYQVGESAGQASTVAVEQPPESRTVLKLNSIASLQLTNASSQHLSTFKLNTVSLLQKIAVGARLLPIVSGPTT